MCQRFTTPISLKKYNSVSQSPNITVSPNLVVDNTTVENVVRQLWPSRHTCEANQQLKILPFQSPCTGTELRGQVTPWKRQHTLQHDFQSFVLPEIAMIVAANTRHGNIPVIRVSGFRIFTFLFGPNFSVKVETEAAGPLARVGAGLGSSLTSTLDLVQVFSFLWISWSSSLYFY